MAELFHVQVQQLLTINLTKYIFSPKKEKVFQGDELRVEVIHT